MNIQSRVAAFIVLIVFALVPTMAFPQITSVANEVVPTEYSSGSQDNVHVFCGEKGDLNASLIATSPNNETASFEWLKYNEATRNFDPFLNDQSGNTTSTISDLADGCYRVNITGTSGVTTYTAWAFNNYIEATAEIPESDCIKFILKGTLISPATFTYIDLPTSQPKLLNKEIEVEWLENGSAVVSRILTSEIFDPPTSNTNYLLSVTDRFDCVARINIEYISIVTKASFEATKPERKSDSRFDEAPLRVTFNNTSENGDAGKFEWFIFRDLDEIKRESAANGGIVKDSILIKIFTDSPEYTFENSGKYMVKLVSKKISEFHTCTDTFYMSDYIVADTAFIEAPNVFTPGNDGVNDKFVIRFFSMKTVKISIFNRWGKVLHVWESNNVQGFSPTIDSTPQAVWDGKVGGKIATPGVYYYVVEGTGRDGDRKRTSGFFHLFRGK
ncbi:MAG: gliding motility-associated C-terminal domain-containing protein [Prolixibacteraceae bacterium]|nr:gliding motility-associated C-terminal domain-containing protein [Prolixibacteraceae bacterium]